MADDHDPPETPTKAARALIGWFAGGLAFQCTETLHEGYWPSLGYGVGAIVVAIVDYKLKALLAGSPKLVRSLNAAASNAWLWIVVGIVSLIVIALSPYIEQQRIPFTAWIQAPPTIVHDPPTADDIAKAAAANANKVVSANEPIIQHKLTKSEAEYLIGAVDKLTVASNKISNMDIPDDILRSDLSSEQSPDHADINTLNNLSKSLSDFWNNFQEPESIINGTLNADSARSDDILRILNEHSWPESHIQQMIHCYSQYSYKLQTLKQENIKAFSLQVARGYMEAPLIECKTARQGFLLWRDAFPQRLQNARREIEGYL